MITSDGWLDWAVRLEPTNRHVNPGANPVKGAFFHSAEGYASVLLDPKSQWGYNGQYSWHFTNLKDGKLYQHYPFTARCWHATAANNDYVGGENEGRGADQNGNRLPPGQYEELTEAQVQNLVHITRDLEAWKGWKATRTGDKTQTLWEHREVVWLGGEGTRCPNGRIPWDEILYRLQEEDMANLNPNGSQRIVSEGNQIVIYNGNIPVLFIGDKEGKYPGQVSKNFGGRPVYLANGGDPDGDGHGEAFWTLEARD